MMQNRCKDCHWFKENESFEILSDGKFCPCSNIGIEGWEYWYEHQKEPEDCDGYCKKGEYVPTGVWADIAEIMKKVARMIEDEI